MYKKYHTLIYEKNGKLFEVQLRSLAIDYDEIYRKAVEEYIDSIVNGKFQAVTASFVLPSLIERGLVINLQNGMLYKSIGRLPDKIILKEFLMTMKKSIWKLFFIIQVVSGFLPRKAM